EAHTVFRFAESPEAGTYTCSGFLPVIGETYTLNIVVNGAHYTASETCIGVPDIGNNIVQNNAGGFGGDEVEISYSYQDKDNEDNYYLQGISTPVAAYPEYKPEDDKKSQGKLMQQYFSDKNLKAGDLVKIRLYGISRRYYDYFRKLLTASGAESGPFQSIPGAVTGNIINQTHAANLAYGYFRVSEVAVKEYTIQ
ncbi:MAG: DUF4249 family protein, partial [Chitinophagaceae bacterium]|nr:DUF4249 family protein [Chitinophagaceae bacterium]